MEKVISYIDYEKISDLMMFLGNNVNLKFNIKLAKKGLDGRRYHFHKEYQYLSNYINQENIITIKRDFEYFLSIESQKDQDFFCMITINDIILLRSVLSNVVHWLDGSIKTFGIKNKKLILLGKQEPIVMQLVTNKILKFEPIVIINANDIQSQGIRLYIDGVYTDINANTFMGFVYLINTVDMFGCAQVMLNYIGSGNNFIGHRTISFVEDDVQEDIKTKAGRFPKSGGSFFTNKLDDM